MNKQRNVFKYPAQNFKSRPKRNKNVTLERPFKYNELTTLKKDVKKSV